DLVTQGTSKKDALLMIQDAIESLVNKKSFKVKVQLEGDSEHFIVSSSKSQLLTSLILKRQRMNRGLSVREVSARIHSKSPNAYAQYEQGRVTPTWDKLVELLEAINPKARPVLVVR
ncbi:MAG: hypothetical protein JWQ35_456, partial [Bacteriovoracaceae bacterium]|nr:hypothetical protein [Bacteriovoracaceae bacterium]